MTTPVRNMAAITLLVGGLALSGCGSDSKSVTLPDGSNLQVDSNGDGATIKSENGDISIGKGLPDGFPSDDVPVIDGTVIGGSKGTAGGPFAWSVILTADGDATTVFDDVSAKLTSAGFTVEQDNAMSTVHVAQFKSDKYVVSVNTSDTDGRSTVTYLVRKAS